ncbi:hypothetical protein HHK36_020622 [Tetracentron sinense]|uniref:Protein TIME FOR COFFEE n=1 Tax=Tetracentron sinense TaxID=13715 RepID=A0A835DBT0_TETSI|nr:hypothetical protein HHK36_020622 [Tetracentron sinense]
MERNREARRGSMAATNGLLRRRQRSSSLRDSPEEDGPTELQETARLRDRGSKKDRQRDRSRRNKRRRGDNRDEGEESTEESVDDEEEDEDEDGGAVRMLPPNPVSSSSLSNHNHRRSFPPAKVVRATPAWKVTDEMIGVSVPRKARSASAKRSHEYWIGGGGGGGGEEQIQRQASTSPARPSVIAPSAAPISPSSSNVSSRKKIKTIGLKHRPPKISKSSSSIQEEIEIEVAEVLYGLMRQPQCPSKQEIITNASQRLDSKDTNGSNNDTKSRVSSPISISPSAAPQSVTVPQNSSSSTAPLPAVAAKRKKPRAMKYEEESTTIFAIRKGAVSSATKVDSEQRAKMEVSSPKFEKSSGSAVENRVASFDLGDSPAAAMSSEPQPDSVKPERNTISDSKSLTEELESRVGVLTKEEEAPSLKKKSPCARLDVHLEDVTATKAISATSELESKREEKFKFDLMAPPSRSSPERDGVIDFVSDRKPTVPDVAMVQKMETVEEGEEKVEKNGKDAGDVGLEEKKSEALLEEAESLKPIAKERILDLQLDLEKHDRKSGTGSKIQNHVQKQQQQQPKASRIDQNAEKTAQSITLPLQMTVAGWPGGLPPLGYMPPLQAVVSMDGSSGSSTALQLPHFLHSQPRPKRCATHYYIARNIFYQEQFTRVNPFWPAPAGSASLYGANSYNLNAMPSTESTIIGNQSQGSFQGKNLNSVLDKGQAETTFSGHIGKEKSSAVLQQAPQQAAAGNLVHGPAFVFPLSQQQAAAAAATRSGTTKSVITTGNVAPSSAANSVPGPPMSSSSTAAAATSLSFNYPNMAANEAQYLAILQNNGYPFSLPYHIGVPPAYRGGAHAQAMPFFNGPFYSPQMIHHQQFQQQKQSLHFQPQPIHQGHQNTSTSSGSTSSHKHSQTQPKQLQGSGRNGVAGNTSSFPPSKDQQPQPTPEQQQNQRAPSPNQARQLEAEMGREDTPSTAHIQVSHPHKSVYGQNFAMPIHTQNFAMMAPAALDGGGSGVHAEKHQQQGMKGGVELIPQAFAMSFASFNGNATAPGLDFSSMAQNHTIFQSHPEAARRGYQIAAAAAQVAQQKKNHQTSEEGKTGGDPINGGEERNAMAGKAPANVGQSLTFSRPDTTDSLGSTILGNTVMDSSARTLDLSSAPVMGNRASRSITTTATTTTATASVSTPNPQQQHLIQLQKQQQMQQLQQQHKFAVAAAARSKASTPPSSSVASKFQNSLSVFPQTLVQSSSPAQSPQWKNTLRTAVSQTPPSLASSTTSSLKNLPQQQGRTQQGHTQISFGMNAKSATAPQGQPLPINNQSQSQSTAVVGSSPTSSISKSVGGSPRTTSTGKKSGPAPTLSLQQSKNSQSGPSRKSSPVGGMKVPSVLSNSHLTTASSSGPKPQLQQQQQQPQMLQQAQLIFSNAAYMQAQSPQSTTTTSATAGYYHQRSQAEQQQQQGSSTSSGMLSMCPPSHSLTGATTSNPSKSAAANNMKGSGLPPPGLLHAAQFAAQSAGNPQQLRPIAFPYLHAVPAAVQVKQAEQKQPAVCFVDDEGLLKENVRSVRRLEDNVKATNRRDRRGSGSN